MGVLKRELKSRVIDLLDTLGLQHALAWNLQLRGLTVVLNFHRISPELNPYWPPIPPDRFDALLGFLKRHFEVVTLAELEAESERPQAVLSFDDGYRDFVDHAMPVMERHDVRCNLNVVPKCIETGRPPWNVRLYDFLHEAPLEAADQFDLPGFEARLSDDSAAAKAAFGAALSNFLKQRPRREREQLWQRVEEVIDTYGPPDRETPMMRRSEVRQALDRHEVGVHSYAHESMGFEPIEYFRDDVDRCLRYFDETFGVRPTIYAFPNGSYRPAQLDYLQDKGFRHILLVEEKLTTADTGTLPRITMGGDSVEELCLRAVGLRAQGTFDEDSHPHQ